MTVRECYDLLEGDYNDALERFGNDECIGRFLFRFLEDKSYENLCMSWRNKDFEGAFRNVHTLKGISMNLGFTKLRETSSMLTEALRNKKGDIEKEALLKQVEECYKQTVASICKFQKENI